MLFILPVLPYSNAPYAGTVCTWHLINHISKKHDVHLIIMGKDYEIKYLEDLKKIATIDGVFLSNTTWFNRIKSVAVQFMKGNLSFGRNTILQWQNAIQDALINGKFDVVHVDFFQTSQFIPAGSKIPMVLSCLDLLLKLELRTANVPEEDYKHIEKWPHAVRRFYEYQHKEFEKYKHIILYSKYDEELLKSVGEYQASVVQPVGQVEELLSVNVPLAERQKNSIMFLGALDRVVNQQAISFFIKEVIPILRTKIADITFHIYGANASDEIKKYQDNVTIYFHGFVDNIAKAYSRHQVVVSPLFLGGGLIFKNLQAMASGTPLISSSIANEGVMGIDGKHLLIANDRESFANQVERLLSSKELWQAISKDAKQFIIEQYSWEVNAAKFESILVNAANDHEVNKAQNYYQ